ncbi:MAG: DUF3494 domain-containing protein [Chitinispirillaceae bacterium]|nr:DUF3494 domain-containing protein [Chitinispirillaceae bacterium]
MKPVLAAVIPLLLFCATNPVDLKPEPLKVTYQTPGTDETAVALNRKIMVTFSEAIDAASITSETFFLQDGPVTIAGAILCIGNTVTLVPARNLTANTSYIASITTKIKDRSGTYLGTLQQWGFTTGAIADTIAPSINAIFPAYGSTGIALDRKISATFSETVDTVTLTPENFFLYQNTSAVSGTLTCNGTIATFVPTYHLLPNTTYAVTITTGITDRTGNTMTENCLWSFTTGDATAGQSFPSLGSASRFAVLAQTISSVGPSTLLGDIGSFHASSINGFPPGTVTGVVFSGDTITKAAGDDLDHASAGLTTHADSFASLPGDDLGGMVIAPGSYRFSSSLSIDSADVTLDAGGDPNAIFLFLIPLSFSISPDRKVILGKGARSGNVFWRVDSAELGANSVLKGTILADQSITLRSGAQLEGRALSKNGSVSLEAGSINLPSP